MVTPKLLLLVKVPEEPDLLVKTSQMLNPLVKQRIDNKIMYVQARNIISLIYGGHTNDYLTTQKAQHVYSQVPRGFGNTSTIQQILEIHAQTLEDIEQIRLANEYLREKLNECFGAYRVAKPPLQQTPIKIGQVYSLYLIYNTMTTEILRF